MLALGMLDKGVKVPKLEVVEDNVELSGIW